MGADPNEYDIGELRQLADSERTDRDGERTDRDSGGFLWYRHGVAVDVAGEFPHPGGWGPATPPTDEDDSVLASVLFGDLAEEPDGTASGSGATVPAVDPESVAEDPILGPDPAGPAGETPGPAVDADATGPVVDPEVVAEDPVVGDELGLADPGDDIGSGPREADDPGRDSSKPADDPGSDPEDSTWARLDRADDPGSVTDSTPDPGTDDDAEADASPDDADPTPEPESESEDGAESDGSGVDWMDVPEDG